MSTVEEFINIRKSIEALITEITTGLKEDPGPRSRERLDEANRQLTRLAAMISNDVQATAVGRLTGQLRSLESRIETTAAKKSSGRKPSAKKAAGKKIETPTKPVVNEEPVIVIFERP